MSVHLILLRPGSLVWICKTMHQRTIQATRLNALLLRVCKNQTVRLFEGLGKPWDRVSCSVLKPGYKKLIVRRVSERVVSLIGEGKRVSVVDVEKHMVSNGQKGRGPGAHT